MVSNFRYLKAPRSESVIRCFQGRFAKPSLFHLDLFVGGHADLILVENRTGVASGLTGCVRSLRVNEKEYDLRKGIATSFIGDALYGLDIGNYPASPPYSARARARVCVCVCACVCMYARSATS
jgi:hypothetical protein